MNSIFAMSPDKKMMIALCGVCKHPAQRVRFEDNFTYWQCTQCDYHNVAEPVD